MTTLLYKGIRVASRSLIYCCLLVSVLLALVNLLRRSQEVTNIQHNQESENSLTTSEGPISNWGNFLDDHTDNNGTKEQRQRVVILAGPHKAASTSLQNFLYFMAGRTVWLSEENKPKKPHQIKRPHAAFKDWAWPYGVAKEFGQGSYRIKKFSPGKFYVPLASLVTGKNRRVYFPLKINQSNNDYMFRVAGYYRDLFRVPWMEGANLVIGSEELDALTMAIGNEFVQGHPPPDEWAPIALDDRDGEDKHVDPHSALMIDKLLDVLPWNATSSSSSLQGQPQRQQLERRDIEVHINYRTPKFDHTVSVWHQHPNNQTLREFFASRAKELYRTNPLGLALQFVRKNLRVTLVDMAGVAADHERLVEATNTTIAVSDANNKNSSTSNVISGQQAIMACEVLKISPSKAGHCDSNSLLHLARSKQPIVSNKKADPFDRDLTEAESNQINDLLEHYDCGVWRHLQAYRARGLLRILHASDSLFLNCGVYNNNIDSDEDIEDLSFAAVVQELKQIARRETA